MDIRRVTTKRAGEMNLRDIIVYFHSRNRLRRWYQAEKEAQGKGFLTNVTKAAGMGQRSSTVSNLLSGFIVNPTQMNQIIDYANGNPTI